MGTPANSVFSSHLRCLSHQLNIPYACLLALLQVYIGFILQVRGALEGGRETKNLKIGVCDIGWAPLAVYDQHMTENGVHNPYLSRFDTCVWSPPFF
jgi:hypothetical protein